MRRRSTWLVIVTTVYLLGALVVGLWPTPVDRALRHLISAALGHLHRSGLPGSYDAIEFTANIFFFVPIGLLVCLLLSRRLWPLAVVLGALLSGAIELSQLLFLPARFASWNDVLANTIGTVIGVLIALVARGIRSARMRRPGRTLSGASRATSAAR